MFTHQYRVFLASMPSTGKNRVKKRINRGLKDQEIEQTSFDDSNMGKLKCWQKTLYTPQHSNSTVVNSSAPRYLQLQWRPWTDEPSQLFQIPHCHYYPPCLLVLQSSVSSSISSISQSYPTRRSTIEWAATLLRNATSSNRSTVGSLSDWMTIIGLRRTLPEWFSFSEKRAKMCDQAFIMQMSKPGSFLTCLQRWAIHTKRLIQCSWFCDNNFIFQGSLQKRHGYRHVHSDFCTGKVHFKIVIFKYFVSNFVRSSETVKAHMCDKKHVEIKLI